MIAVVAGATGLVGEILTQKLLNDPDVQQVKVITRKPFSLSHSKVAQLVVPDFSKIEDYKDDLKGTHYFCALGTTIKTAGSQENFRKVDYDAIVNFGHIAAQNQAQSLAVVSAMGADEDSSFFYNRVKGETEKDLQALSIKNLLLYRPGLLLGDRKEHRSGEKVATLVANVLTPLLPKSWVKAMATEAETLAARMIADSKKGLSGTKVISSKEI